MKQAASLSNTSVLVHRSVYASPGLNELMNLKMKRNNTITMIKHTMLNTIWESMFECVAIIYIHVIYYILFREKQIKCSFFYFHYAIFTNATQPMHIHNQQGLHKWLKTFHDDIDGLVQHCSNSSALAMV